MMQQSKIATHLLFAFVLQNQSPLLFPMAYDRWGIPSQVRSSPSDLNSACYLFHGLPGGTSVSAFVYASREARVVEDFLKGELGRAKNVGNIGLAESLRFLSRSLYIAKDEHPVLVMDEASRRRYLQSVSAVRCDSRMRTRLKSVVMYYLQARSSRPKAESYVRWLKHDAPPIWLNIHHIAKGLSFASKVSPSFSRPYPVRQLLQAYGGGKMTSPHRQRYARENSAIQLES